MHLGMFSFVEGYPYYLGGVISTAKGAYYNGGKIDHKLQHIIDDIITVLMISFCTTDDMIHLSLLLGSILPMEVKSVQSALSDLKRPPERLQSQCNYRLFIT